MIGYKKRVIGTYQSVLKWSHDHQDFSASWSTGDAWRVTEAWSAVLYWQYIVTVRSIHLLLYRSNYIYVLPKCIHGDRLLRAALFGLFLSAEKYFNLSWQKDSSVLKPPVVPGLAQSTGPTVLSTTKLVSIVAQSTAYIK